MTAEQHPADAAEAALRRVVAAMPEGEDRPGQLAMARAVAQAIDDEAHLVVQAGTGTGKSQAYLVPALLSGRRTVVVTSTILLVHMKAWLESSGKAPSMDGSRGRGWEANRSTRR